MNLHQKCEVCGSIPATREIEIILANGRARLIALCEEKKCFHSFLRRAEGGYYDGFPPQKLEVENNGFDIFDP